MMRALTIFLTALTLSVCVHADEQIAPFAAVRLHDGSTVAASLPVKSRWLIKIGFSEPRLTSPGETFELHDGESLLLFLRHVSHDVTCHIAPPPAGIEVTTKEDTRSVGGVLTTKTQFIKAQ